MCFENTLFLPVLYLEIFRAACGIARADAPWAHSLPCSVHAPYRSPTSLHSGLLFGKFLAPWQRAGEGMDIDDQAPHRVLAVFE